MLYYIAIAVITIAEIALFIMLLSFFRRLARSEDMLTDLQDSQQALLDKLQLNANLENELMQSFTHRQRELATLDMQIEQRVAELKKLLEQAEQVSRSPHFLREVIINGRRKGQNTVQLAKSTGLSVDEVELILAQTMI